MADNNYNSDDKGTTAKFMAYALLFAFVGAIAILFFVNISIGFHVEKLENADVKGWFELLKNILIALGASLTTILGYYFGQRGVEKTEQKLDESKKLLQTAVEEKIKTGNEASELAKILKKDDIATPSPDNLPKKSKLK